MTLFQRRCVRELLLGRVRLLLEIVCRNLYEFRTGRGSVVALKIEEWLRYVVEENKKYKKLCRVLLSCEKAKSNQGQRVHFESP